MTSTYCTARLIAVPENVWLCEPPPPVALVAPKLAVCPFTDDALMVPPVERSGFVWVWLGISFVVSVVLPTEPLTACDANAEVNATEPPELTAPLTTRRALLSCVVTLVHPVGADVCWNNIAVPAGIGEAAIAAVTNAVLAICVLLVPAVAVGAVGVPENAPPENVPLFIAGDVSVLLVSV